MTHFLFITPNYPSKSKPYSGVFVQNIVRQMAKIGIRCTVISPVSYTEGNKETFDDVESFDDFYTENPIHIIRPRYMSFSNRKVLGYSLFNISTFSFKRSILNTINKYNIIPTHIYGHFIYPSGYAAVEAAKKLGVPSIIAVGESGTNFNKTVYNGIGVERAKHQLRDVSKIVSVSNRNGKLCVDKLNIDEAKIKVFPNGVDLNLFRPYNKLEMRKELNLPNDEIIIAFTGHFNHRKGADRVIQATQGMKNVKLMLIGDGGEITNSDNITFKGKLSNSELPKYLSAADFFVLPTLEEGSCNAILEAFACGLPVISSIGEFNDDILNEEVSIRINPLEINEIENAIETLKENKELREKMSINALEHIKNYDLEKRAKRIYNWIIYSK